MNIFHQVALNLDKLMEQDKSKKNDIIDEFGFGIYGCRRKSRYGSSCCGYRFHIELAQF